VAAAHGDGERVGERRGDAGDLVVAAADRQREALGLEGAGVAGVRGAGDAALVQIVDTGRPGGGTARRSRVTRADGGGAGEEGDRLGGTTVAAERAEQG